MAGADGLQEYKKACFVVFGCLMVLTVLTVAVAYIKMQTQLAIAVALCIAGAKMTLVLGWFMHLVSEKAIIRYSLAMTFFFFIFLLLLPVINDTHLIGS
ncbi:MAG: cytochrome C oxidase subunit IV family protein [Oligoflexales bacterium]